MHEYPYHAETILLSVACYSCDHLQQIQWNPSITDTTGTKHFVLYSEVSFAQGVIVDHAPLTIVASYAGARL